MKPPDEAITNYIERQTGKMLFGILYSVLFTILPTHLTHTPPLVNKKDLARAARDSTKWPQTSHVRHVRVQNGSRRRTCITREYKMAADIARESRKWPQLRHVPKRSKGKWKTDLLKAPFPKSKITGAKNNNWHLIWPQKKLRMEASVQQDLLVLLLLNLFFLLLIISLKGGHHETLCFRHFSGSTVTKIAQTIHHCHHSVLVNNFQHGIKEIKRDTLEF